MKEPRIIIFGRDDETTRMVYHRLAAELTIACVVIEDTRPGLSVFKQRVKRLGILTALGQALFVKLLVPVLRRFAKRRLAEIKRTHALSEAPLPEEVVQRVRSINELDAAELVERTNATHIVVFGTRLISATLLNAISVPVINIHLGWNPQYRGGNGAYWALSKRDTEHCGVTVHIIDEGIDTGGVLARRTIVPTANDSFVTYPFLQLAAGLDALAAVLHNGSLMTIDTKEEPSALWFHPTLWGYLWRRFLYGVK